MLEPNLQEFATRTLVRYQHNFKHHLNSNKTAHWKHFFKVIQEKEVSEDKI